MDEGEECWSTKIPHHALSWQIETEFKFLDDGNMIVQRKINNEWTVVWTSNTSDRPDLSDHPSSHHLTL